MKKSYVYILSSDTKTLYIWVTSNLIKRIYEHKNKFVDWFSKKYNCINLIYYEEIDTIKDAIIREKRIKKWKREWKVNLINDFNPLWEDLYEDILS